MLPFLQFIIAIVIIIIAAKMGGYLSYRLRQPTVVGEVIAGLILGPTVLNFLHWPMFTDEHLGETITLLVDGKIEDFQIGELARRALGPQSLQSRS